MCCETFRRIKNRSLYDERSTSMYGTVARLQPGEGREADVMQVLAAWERDHAPRVNAQVSSYVLRSERRPGELLLIAIFPDKASYQANAAAPEQDQWYRSLREHLDQDPIWEDGEISPLGQAVST
jgi:quinol monooxygenase YgiN